MREEVIRDWRDPYWIEAVRVLADEFVHGRSRVSLSDGDPGVIEVWFPREEVRFDIRREFACQIGPWTTNSYRVRVLIVDRLITADRQSRWREVKAKYGTA